MSRKTALRRSIAVLIQDGKLSQQQIAEQFEVSVQVVKIAQAWLEGVREGIGARSIAEVLRTEPKVETVPAMTVADIVLAPHQVDPDFKGTKAQFATEYGHVPLATKMELDRKAAVARADRLSVWLRDFNKIVANCPTEAPSLEDVDAWAAEWKDKAPERWKKFLDRFEKFVVVVKMLSPLVSAVTSKLKEATQNAEDPTERRDH